MARGGSDCFCRNERQPAPHHGSSDALNAGLKWPEVYRVKPLGTHNACCSRCYLHLDVVMPLVEKTAHGECESIRKHWINDFVNVVKESGMVCLLAARLESRGVHGLRGWLCDGPLVAIWHFNSTARQYSAAFHLQLTHDSTKMLDMYGRYSVILVLNSGDGHLDEQSCGKDR